MARYGQAGLRLPGQPAADADLRQPTGAGALDGGSGPPSRTWLESRARLRWTSPLENEKFAEYRDAAFLKAIELHDAAEALRHFWPKGGPVWDGLAVIERPEGEAGVILAEGKSYPDEFYSGGTPGDERRLLST